MLRIFVLMLMMSATLGISQEHSQRWQLSLEGDDYVRLEVPYTLGTHQGSVATLDGFLVRDASSGRYVAARMQVPLSSLSMSKPEMTCHMFEALGLNYETSGYPKAHVCDHSHSLPSEGPDAVAYPEITFSLKSLDAQPGLDEGDWKGHKLVGDWTLHGVTKTLSAWVHIKQDYGFRKMKGVQEFPLSEFGIQTIPFLKFIRVKDRVRVPFQVTLK